MAGSAEYAPAVEPEACRAVGSANAPLTRWPELAEPSGSATVRVASPAVEMTFAVVDAK